MAPRVAREITQDVDTAAAICRPHPPNRAGTMCDWVLNIDTASRKSRRLASFKRLFYCKVRQFRGKDGQWEP
jgi:hypothetical protein